MGQITQYEEDTLHQYYSRYGGFWVYPDILDFCYLVNPYFLSSPIIEELEKNFRVLLSEYPSGIKVNSKLASNCWNIKEEYVIPGNGAAELIKILMENIDGRIGIIRPTFEEYPNRIDKGTVVAFYPQNDTFRYSAEDIINYFCDKSINSLILINPDNPSGNFIGVNGLHHLAHWCDINNIRLILDESFVDFSVDFQENTFLDNSILESYPKMCVVKSISKSYGVPGLRLGILSSADTDLISTLKKKVSIWNINSFAQFFMQIFPKYRRDYERACREFIAERENFKIMLSEIPYIKVMPSQANYFFIEVLAPYNSEELCAILLNKYNILASACLAKKGLEGNKYIRIAVRNHNDNSRLFIALKELIG